MTRTLFIIAGLLLAALVATVVGGLAGTAPGLLMIGMLCAGPLSMLTLGAALGRASNEFVIQRKQPRMQVQQSAVNSRLKRVQGEPLG